MSEKNEKVTPTKHENRAEDSSAGKLRFIEPRTTEWRPLRISDAYSVAKDEPEQKAETERKVADSREKLRDVLNSSLQMPNLVVLAGSGTSLGPEIGGPSMWDLWDHAVLQSPGTDRKEEQLVLTETAEAILKIVGFDVTKHGQNIEALLSQCESYLQFQESEPVSNFIKDCRGLILKKCTQFLRSADDASWNDSKVAAHRTFLHRLSKRRTRDPRLKIFTTNYDLCFERAASLQDLIVLDGLSFYRPRRFSPSFFDYDIVRRPSGKTDVGDYLEGVFSLFKLHGSVSWERSGEDIVEVEKPSDEAACLIYPARGKYQQSFLQPHLELLSQYLNSLRQPNTCLLIAGFGFNDDHLTEPIYAAIKTNPQLRVVIADWKAEDHLVRPDTSTSLYWKRFGDLAASGSDVWFVNASFKDLASLLPDLGSMSPGEQLEKVIRRLK